MAQGRLKRQRGCIALLLRGGEFQCALWRLIAAHQLVIALLAGQGQCLLRFAEALAFQQPFGQLFIEFTATLHHGFTLRRCQLFVAQHALLHIDSLLGVIDGLGHLLHIYQGLGYGAVSLPLPVVHILGNADGPDLRGGLRSFQGVIFLAQ